MSEVFRRTPESVRDEVRISEVEVEEKWRRGFLDRHLFHYARLDSLYPGDIGDSATLHRLEQDFLEDKRHLNMGERFALALSEKYLGKIHVVELGSTDQPDDSGAIDGLRGQYNDLLSWMQSKELVVDELPRKDSGRTISMRPPRLKEHATQVMVVVRNRPLIDTVIVHNGQKVKVMIAKRMVFSMPMQAARALTTRDRLLEVESTKEIIETQLQHGSGGVHPIRTAYYLGTDIVGEVRD